VTPQQPGKGGTHRQRTLAVSAAVDGGQGRGGGSFQHQLSPLASDIELP